MLPVLVTDKKGKFVDGLEQGGLPGPGRRARASTLDTFERDDSAPVSFAFLVDTSGSMGIGNKLENAKNAIRTDHRATAGPATTSRSSRSRRARSGS